MAARRIKCNGNIVSENKSLKSTIPSVNSIISDTNNIRLNLLNGTLILYNKVKPVKPVNITARVDTSASVILIIFGKKDIITTLVTMVRAVGKAVFMTFIMILPFILSLFGSRARINDGIPMVTMLVKVSCIGTKGYVVLKNINMIASKVAYVVLQRNNEADL